MGFIMGVLLLLVAEILIFRKRIMHWWKYRNSSESVEYSTQVSDEVSSKVMMFDSTIQSYDGSVELSNVLLDVLGVDISRGTFSDVIIKVVRILQPYLGVKNLTILMTTGVNRVALEGSNADKRYLRDIEAYCNLELYRMSSDSIVYCSDSPLAYPSAEDRGICYASLYKVRDIDNTVIGALFLEHSEEIGTDSDNYGVYEKVFQGANLILRNIYSSTKLLKEVSTDQLTQVFNRRYLDRTLTDALMRQKAVGKEFCIGLIDIDFFKKFNDTYGHQHGDAVLTEVAQYLKKSLGDDGWVARYGGEEFVVYCGRHNAKTAEELLNSLRVGVSHLKIMYEGRGEAVNISIGMGVANVTDTLTSLVKRADANLYKAKETGRNKVVV